MIIKRSPILLILFIFWGMNFYAQKEWIELNNSEYNKSEREVYLIENFPTKYSLVSLNLNAFTQKLSIRAKKGNQTIELPDSNGKLKKFLVKETSNFQFGLQQKFPEIKSYIAKGIDDSSEVARISIGKDGFHAVIYSKNHSTTYIDPYSIDNNDYIIYNRNNLPKIEKDFQCKVEANAKSQGFKKTSNKLINDGKLRTYRLAIVCSGEYAQFHLNRQNVDENESDQVKKAAVLSAMNTSMTRINGVFEKDLGVKMVIVEDNDKVIYLDPATDNITDGNATIMINQVQSICDSQIGNANYDIGHIFSIGGSGLAGLGVVCQTGSKARGVTGISSPTSDPYDIDYVAHEIGHQFGANHTQNNSCNRNFSTAIEVGSGSTIMGYAGICAPNVIGVGNSTGNSDDYFHTVSIAEMQDFITTSTSCAELTDTFNSTPTANAGDDFSIPKSTPFKLTGVATDADGLNSLTYNWEQIDNEIGSMPPSSTNTFGPMFRSLPSKVTPVRYFPSLSTVIGGGNSNTWEVLPSVERELNFAFTVRDNHQGGGSTARDDMKLTVVNSDPFIVTSQQNNIIWDTSSTQTITWNVGETNLPPINCSFVNIRLSTDGGLTFPILLKSNTPNDGSENLVIPDEPSSDARIMVEAVGNVFYNLNSGNIIINSITPTFVLTNTSNSQSACNSGNESVNYFLNIDFVNGFSENVTFSASGQPQGAQVTFNPSEVNSDGTIEMTISNFDGLTPSNYVISVKGVSNSITKNIDAVFQLTSPNFDSLTLLAPSNNATDVDLVADLSWDIDSNAIAYDVEVSRDINFNTIVSDETDITNNYFTTNALDPLTTYYWRVRPKNNCGTGSYSSTFSFTTQECVICSSSGNTSYETSTTLVEFNTIQNSSTKRDANDVEQGYFDYTDLSTTVKVDEVYNLTINVNTDGGYQTQTKVWIDWDGDCVFNETTEEYDLGSASNVDNGATSESPFSITIPNNAKLGNTIMRVSTKYTPSVSIVYPTSCELSFDGEVEDYTLNIEEATASVQDVSFNKFNLFPNPNSGIFTLTFEADSLGKTTLELLDLNGRVITNRIFSISDLNFKESIDFKQLSKGIYLLRIKNGVKQTTRKLVIK